MTFPTSRQRRPLRQPLRLFSTTLASALLLLGGTPFTPGALADTPKAPLQLPDILVKETYQPGSFLSKQPMDSAALSTQKAPLTDAGEGKEALTVRHNGLVRFGAGGGNRRFLNGWYDGDWNAFRLSSRADIESKNSSNRNDRYDYQHVDSTANILLTSAMSLDLNIRYEQNDLEMPGIEMNPRNDNRREDLIGGGFTLEHIKDNWLTRFSLDSESMDIDESIAGSALFRLQQGSFFISRNHLYAELAIQDNRLKESFSETTGSILVGMTKRLKNGYYDVKLGVWNGSRNSVSPVGQLIREWDFDPDYRLRLNVENSFAFTDNSALYLRDYTTKVQRQFLPATQMSRVEVSMKHDPRPDSTVGVSGFAESRGEFVVFDYDTVDELYVPNTINRVRFAGVAFTAKTKAIKPFTLGADYMFSKENHRRDDFDSLPYHSRHQFDASAKLNYKDIEALLAYRFRGRRMKFVNNSDSLPSIGTVDLDVAYTGWRFFEGDVSAKIFGTVENLFDDRYEYRAFFPAEGRIIRIGIEANF